ncbi:MAG: MATE family efflux transporter [Proteiniphilum sp.]|uniref:lipopolysaccharide biosynthesis protein n=1 Tax=Proteiniphilum sp. TaxID=1926877 RepID=UPI002B20A464|nr:lipopolysaccharide biosynthesis protein [Proteiniphilum sp.]MEA5129458.1 MATE family efflux transporter [Proteiniphilum sp.]
MEKETAQISITSNSKRIAKNTMMLYFRMILTMLVSLYTSRIILMVLGVEDYGINNVVGGVVTMFAFFNTALSSATQRFLSFEIGKNNFVQLRKTFNVALIIHIGIAIFVLILAETIGLWFVKTYLVIPEERMEAALWVYHFSVLSFLISIIQVPYNATIISHERMNVYAYLSILEVCLKLFIVFMIATISFDKLKLYGLLHFSVVFMIALIFIMYTRKHFKESKLMMVTDKQLYQTIFSFSLWNLLGSIAVIMKGQGVNILLNLFYGPVVNAARAIAYQVQGVLYGFVQNFQIALKPQIIKSYAGNDMKYMYQLIFQGTKFSYYLLFGLSFPVILEPEIILSLWLKSVPEYSVIFLQLVLIDILVESTAGPLVASAHASGKIKLYQTVIGILFLLNLPISYFCLRRGYQPEVTMYISIIITILALFSRIIMVSNLVGFSKKDYLKKVLLPIISVTVASIIPPLLIQHYFEAGNERFFVVIISFIFAFISAVYVIGVNRIEKDFIRNKILSYIKKH